MAATTFRELRHKLDDLGYYQVSNVNEVLNLIVALKTFFILQSLVPESVPLVEALLHDLLATTHNLKICKEQASSKAISLNNVKTLNSFEKFSL